MVSRVNANLNKPYAFICYEKHDEAQKAIDITHNVDIFQVGEKVYCGWHMTKAER